MSSANIAAPAGFGIANSGIDFGSVGEILSHKSHEAIETFAASADDFADSADTYVIECANGAVKDFVGSDEEQKLLAKFCALGSGVTIDAVATPLKLLQIPLVIKDVVVAGKNYFTGDGSVGGSLLAAGSRLPVAGRVIKFARGMPFVERGFEMVAEKWTTLRSFAQFGQPAEGSSYVVVKFVRGQYDQVELFVLSLSERRQQTLVWLRTLVTRPQVVDGIAVAATLKALARRSFRRVPFVIRQAAPKIFGRESSREFVKILNHNPQRYLDALEELNNENALHMARAALGNVLEGQSGTLDNGRAKALLQLLAMYRSVHADATFADTLKLILHHPETARALHHVPLDP